MKRNFLQVAGAVALSLTVAFAGCSRDEGDASSAPRSVILKVALPEVATRAEAAPESGQETFQPGWLFFTNAGGTITRALQITPTGNYQSTTPDGNEVGVGQFSGGVEILNVPGPSAKVHVISNLPATGTWTTWNATNAVGKNISEYAGESITVQSQYNGTTAGPQAEGDGSAVTLYGSGDITPVMAGAPDEFEATVALVPIAGRVEITKFSTDILEITGFDVTGVFVNNYYPALAIDGTIGTSAITDNGSTVGNYVSGSTSYQAIDLEKLFNVGTYSAVSQEATPPTSGDVWAYNLLAPALGTGQHYFPHIVIKIENITVADPVNAAFAGGTTWYLTIANVQVNGTGAYLDFVKGNIYRLEEVAFTLSDLGSLPELTTKKVTVAVSVTAWAGQTVTPVLQ
jgi:hypothetical protein